LLALPEAACNFDDLSMQTKLRNCDCGVLASFGSLEARLE